MVVLNNSLSIDVKNTYNISNFNNTRGGLSGNPLYPYTEKLVESVHKKYSKLPIIACGGVDTGEKAWSLINKGASFIELYSGITFHGLNLIVQINKTLQKKLDPYSYQTFIDKRNLKYS